MHDFSPGHASLAQPKKGVLESPLVSLTANAGAVVVGGAILKNQLSKDKEDISYFWGVAGVALVTLGALRAFQNLAEVG